MNNKNRKTLKNIFKQPVPADLRWGDIELLFLALGCEIQPGRGSRVRISHPLMDVVFHKPHPHPQVKRVYVKSVRIFLESIGVKHDAL